MSVKISHSGLLERMNRAFPHSCFLQRSSRAGSELTFGPVNSENHIFTLASHGGNLALLQHS